MIYQHLWGTENQGLSRYSPVHYQCCLVLFVRDSLCFTTPHSPGAVNIVLS
ncbi:hypothetical protein SARI_00293 [Salmonella enterica subsp. arizonae serovar 62:z4,z23:-]|uniref:Uncharacterized protein n=1 Tax=Salmonella arizonae (strain ATCC BAA-731 / CDC346-86 / RSK2980) TaxID=41514 RepID=A9MGX3_SALAR|nr:hypothetical protein SARI_00293 [Salmonella enterica subsp. arizonae serovar 62:z4,z23:-]